MLRAVPVAVVNKWLKNFDENPHRLRICRALPRRESVMKPRCAAPCGQVCSPVLLLRRLLLTQSNAFQWGQQTPKISHYTKRDPEPT